MDLQMILQPVYPIFYMGAGFTNNGEIDLFFVSADRDQGNFKQPIIIKRRFPDGSVKWFEKGF